MITRDNYEEYFLLYADNELPAAERSAVENFIAGHPDLREEWEALLHCRLSPEAGVVFPGRASLMKPGSDESAFTEDLLLYLDGELDPAGRERIEDAIRHQPLIAKELADLRQTVCSPDPAISYPDKTGLYKPERSRRIAFLPWLRAGIAAAIAGAVVVGLLLPAPRRNGSPVAPAVTATSTSPTPATPGKPDPTASAPRTSTTHDRYLAEAVTSGAASPLHHRTGKRPATGSAGSVHDGTAPDVTATLAATDPGKSGVHPDPVGTVAMNPLSDVTTMAVGRPAPGYPGADDLAVNARPAVQRGIPKEQSSFATQALQEEANEERAGNLIGDETAAPAKAGLRGIFRKVTRAFGKTADRDDEGNRQVLVGAFQVPIN
ncbi:MAG TPA: hypothetical protein VN616_03530 [Puia sp.]|nr:hypothetical protein [Puia sp.]